METKKNNKIRNYIIAAIISMGCICCFLYVAILGNNKSVIPTQPVSLTENILSQVPLATNTQPEPTLEILLNQTLEEFSKQYESLTDLQKQDFKLASYGKKLFGKAMLKMFLRRGYCYI